LACRLSFPKASRFICKRLGISDPLFTMKAAELAFVQQGRNVSGFIHDDEKWQPIPANKTAYNYLGILNHFLAGVNSRNQVPRLFQLCLVDCVRHPGIALYDHFRA